MRIPFLTAFKVTNDNMIEPIRRIRIGGVTMGPGTKIGPGVQIAGVNLAQFIQHDLEVIIDNDVWVILGIYPV